MKNLSDHITDIAQNSTRARASVLHITLILTPEELTLRIRDNGSGMSPDMLATVSDPFTTSRTTRKVGMGLSLLRQSAEQTEGAFSIESELGKGTTVEAVFKLNHWDMLPMGDLSDTIVLLVGGNPDVDFVFTYQRDTQEPFVFDTIEVKEIMDGTPLSNLKVMKMLKELISSNIE